MKKIVQIFLLSAMLMLLNSCSVVEGIFKAGVWSGILIVVIVIALVIWIFAKLFGGRKE
ncbi:hypothetical protein [Sphingobacterium wenxiniae]|uniref:Phosphatidate cytidylyltransferase n=1 Tax=Sphingobacterium wenxiniae TaxID=683125 RepID=A0A1I6ULD0_9SPHI|nr:hypothetical protein [Sphingobacterium wenxiniae]SFT02087.1 hypothetical protein SAMN05660206_10973 [Sphingobacterium wenxiniae]